MGVLSCNAPLVSGLTGQYGGTKQVGNVCQSQRKDLGRISQYGVSGFVTGGDLSCQQVYSDSSYLEKAGVYVSETQCPHGTSIFDCNGYMKDEIDFCSESACENIKNVRLVD